MKRNVSDLKKMFCDPKGDYSVNYLFNSLITSRERDAFFAVNDHTLFDLVLNDAALFCTQPPFVLLIK